MSLLIFLLVSKEHLLWRPSSIWRRLLSRYSLWNLLPQQSKIALIPCPLRYAARHICLLGLWGVGMAYFSLCWLYFEEAFLKKNVYNIHISFTTLWGLNTACIHKHGSAEGIGQLLIYILYTSGPCFRSELRESVCIFVCLLDVSWVWAWMKLVYAFVVSLLGCHFIVALFLLQSHLLYTHNRWQKSNLWKFSFFPTSRSLICFFRLCFLQVCCMRQP